MLLDPNTWSTDGSVSLGSYSVSHDGRYVAYQVKKNNSDEATLEILDIGTKKKLAETIPGAKYQVLPDQQHNVDPNVIGPALAAFFNS